MRIGILGTGDVGKALGTGFASLGHEVKIGSRDPNNPKLSDWLAKGPGKRSSGTFEQAASFGEVLVLATHWSGTQNAITLAGPPNFAGKVVIDATNPLNFGTMPPTLTHGHSDSGGEQVQRWLPQARVVKAFNIVGNAHMFRPDLPGGTPDMFIAGNGDTAKTTVAAILKSFGWEVVD